MSDDEPADSDRTAADDAASESPAPESDAPASDDDAPLSDLARRLDRQRRDRAERDAEESASDPGADLSQGEFSEVPPDPDEDPFERMSVGEIDEETLWSSLGADETPGVGVDAAPDTDTGSLGDVGPAPGVESAGDAGPGLEEHVVPKDKYCQSCPYLHDPPELACTHEGTDIVEVVDSERFRVRNCPMVEGGVEPPDE